MADELNPPILDRDLPEEVVGAREESERLYKQERKLLRPRLKAHLATYRDALNTLAAMLRAPLDTSDLDLAADTRWTALHLLCGRSVSLGLALLGQVEAGFGVEAYPTARALHEANRMIMVFSDEDEDGLLREWLAGRYLKPDTVRRALARGEARENARLRAEGKEPVSGEARRLDRELYRALSESGHLVRSSVAMSVSHSTRSLVIGPSPDYAMRAYFIGWAGEVVEEILYVVGGVLGWLAGRNFYAECIQPILDSLEEVRESHPLPEEMERNSPVEFELVEDDEPEPGTAA